jgi:beta-carotene ketolase (CrtO type)
MTAYDVVVIGAGHNGLICAAYLARAGRRVLVLEAQEEAGGFCLTTAPVAEAPGFLMNPYALDFVTINLAPSVVDELDLARYGLRWVRPDPIATYLGPDGVALSLWQDRRRTVEEIRRLSVRDACAYDRFALMMGGALRMAGPYLQAHPTRPGLGTVGTVVRQALAQRRELADVARIMLSSADQVIEEWFERDELKATLGFLAAGTMMPLNAPGSGAAVAAVPWQHQTGLRRPVGGSGAFIRALVACLAAYGGEVRTGTPVQRILADSGRADGVQLDDGTVIHAADVVAAVDPHTLLTDLLDPALVPDDALAQLRGMRVLGSNLSLFTGHVALSRPLRFPEHALPEQAGASVVLIPPLDGIRRWCEAGLRGEVADGDVPLWVLTPSAFDRSLVPPGSTGDTLYLYPAPVPYGLADGSEWSQGQDKFLVRCLDRIEDYAPGTADTVIGTHAVSPTVMSRGAFRGHYSHVDLTFSQLGPWRPIPALAAYRTPVDGLWHSGAGAHPFGTINGWSGRTTARTLLRAGRPR